MKQNKKNLSTLNKSLTAFCKNVKGQMHTSYCVSWCRLAPPHRLITDPLFTAATGDFNPLWVLAPQSGGLRLITQRNTANRPIYTQTLISAIGLEALAITIDYTIVFTTGAWQI